MRITRTINSIIVLFLYITTISCIKNKNLYDDSLAEKKVISNPEFLYPYINEPISHTAEITIHIKEGVRRLTLSDAVIPPLKYNKSWLFMLTQDDCRHAAFCYTWAAINGKPLSKKSFYDLPHLQTNDLPSDCYYLGKTLGSTDGAENEVRFSFATTLAPEEKWMDNVTTINKKDNGFHEQNGLVWGNVKEMLNFGIGIAFHDVMATDINNPNDILAHYEIAQNIILNRLGRGCKMLAEPNGNKNYVEAAHNYPVIKTFTLQTGGERIHPFEEMLNLENKLIERIFFNNHDEIKEKIVNELSYPCEQREIIYAGVHGTDTSWAEFLLWLNDTYGQDGDDSMWMPNQEEYYEYNYYQVHGTTEVNYENEHTIKLTVHLPGQEYFYYPSVTVNLSGIKKEDIKQISSNDEVTGLSFANYENGIMLNIDCRKYLAEHAENFVKRYETNPTSVSAKADALYFVNMLKDSDKKTELKKRVE
ncbi:hypothetical protein [Bacteroides xylanisolvens]|uniref:hypothetical protein n=1 Tax=Bacteroides xylanisolvens TaxID=371601 RepID=UPI0018654E3B|nr:hypothetical protein [Bacteroides xylanisolvens]